MSPIDLDVVRRKLERIIENLDDLREIHGAGFEEYSRDRKTRKLAERCLQEAIEAASDLNSHILVESGFAAPTDYFTAFLKMGEFSILDLALAEKLAPSAGLRNRIVHEYDLLDNRKIFDAIKVCLELYPDYIRSIRDYCSK
jgi:uncharacterized protein YutE (UPF0331/DUF86 family)